MPRAIGLDIRDDRLHAVLMERSGKSFRLRRALVLRREDLEEDGADWEDQIDLANALKARFLAGAWRRSPVCLGVSSRQSMARFLHLPIVPSWRLRLIMSHEIQQVAEQAGEEMSADYSLVVVPEPEVEENLVFVALARNREIHDRLTAFSSVGWPIDMVLPSSIATFNTSALVLSSLVDERDTTLYLDVGTVSTELVIGHGSGFVFARNLPFGLEEVIQALATREGLSKADAKELLLSEPTDGLPDSTFEKLVRLVKSAFPFCKSQTKWPTMKPGRVVLSGVGASAPSLASLLEQQLGIPSAPVGAFEFIDTSRASPESREVVEEHGDLFAVAVGLAATSLVRGSFQLDLLPNDFKKKRELRNRTVYLVATVAIILIYLAYGLIVSNMSLKEAAKKRRDLDRLSTSVANQEQENEKRQKAIRERWEFLEQLSGRSDNGYFLGRLLLILEDSVPPRVRLDKVSLDKDEDTGRPRLTISGQSDNRDDGGWRRLAELKENLRRQADIESVSDLEAPHADAKTSVVYYKLLLAASLGEE